MANLENIDTNKVKLTFEISKEKLNEGINQAYEKNKSKYSMPGFRKGKVPKSMLISQYGEGLFFEDAVNFLLPESYDAAVEEHNLEVVSKPKIDVEDISLENGAIVTAEVYVKPIANISDYKGISYKKADISVSEEEILAEINKARKQNARIISIEDRPIKLNDIVSIDFEGFIDGIPFEGGKGENYDLTIGSKTFIDNFEDQLIGKNINDDVEVTVIFPGEYGKEELQNKPAVFKVKINEIKEKELPKLDNEFAEDVSEFDNLTEYKKDLENKLQKSKKDNAKIHIENSVMEKIIEKVQVELPEVMVDNQINQMLNDFSNRIKSQGLSLESYLQYSGQTIEEIQKSYSEPARKQVLGRLALEAIYLNENIQATNEEIDEEISKMASDYNMELERLKEVMRDGDRESLAKDIKVQKALNFVIENSIEE